MDIDLQFLIAIGTVLVLFLWLRLGIRETYAKIGGVNGRVDRAIHNDKNDTLVNAAANPQPSFGIIDEGSIWPQLNRAENAKTQ